MQRHVLQWSQPCWVLLVAAAGTAMLGVGCAAGPDRAEQAALAAVSAPLIQQSVERATGVLGSKRCIFAVHAAG